MRIFNTKTIAIALAIPGLALATPAIAAAPNSGAQTSSVSVYAPASADVVVEHKRGKRHGHRGRNSDRYNDGYGYGNDYRQSNYGEPLRRDTRVWRGRDGQYYCQRENGTTGLLIGAAVGGLIGNEVARRGDKTIGAILGAAGGALLGRTIDRSNSRCR